VAEGDGGGRGFPVSPSRDRADILAQLLND